MIEKSEQHRLPHGRGSVTPSSRERKRPVILVFKRLRRTFQALRNRATGYDGTINVRTLPPNWFRRHWLASSFLILVMVPAAVLLIRWQATLNFLGGFLVSSQHPQSADLILVLAGDFWGPRAVKGADLALEGYAPLALMSGTPYQGRPDGELAIEGLTQRGYPARLFQSFAHNSRSTIEEAIALRPELARRRVKRVLLVTTAYHSRRAAIVFRLFCPGIQFIAIAAPDAYHPDGWWKDPASKILFYSEWRKILGTILVVYPKHCLSKIIGKRDTGARHESGKASMWGQAFSLPPAFWSHQTTVVPCGHAGQKPGGARVNNPRAGWHPAPHLRSDLAISIENRFNLAHP
jgi:uncharacterized SAM-binding protein YcdF (DUF218 family)